MNKFVAAMLAGLFLAGCDGNPFTPIIGGEDPTEPAEPVPGDSGDIPQQLARNLHSVSYDPEAGTLVMQLTSLDEAPLNATYTRTPALDRPGYHAYTVQNDPLDRHFTAMVARSNDPQQSVQAGVASDGGQFNRYFSGGFYERNAAFTRPAPEQGLVSYAGTYTGVTNLPAPGDQLQPLPPGTPSELVPRQSTQTTGEVFLNVDFNDNTVNGAIYNRQLVQYGNQALPSIVLVVTDIAADGTFFGDRVEYENVLNNDIGDYGGIFGGTGGSAVGGIVSLTQFDGPGDPLGIQNEEELGVFVLNKCGVAGDSPICANVGP